MRIWDLKDGETEKTERRFGNADFNVQIPANAMMFFFLLGLTYRMMEFRGEKGRRKRRKRQQ